MTERHVAADGATDPVDDLDLTPRPAGDGRRRPRRGAMAAVVGLAVLGGLAVVVYQGLTNASLYFRNVDEAVAQRQDLGDRRFRLQGTVVDAEESSDDEIVVFHVAHHDVTAEVRHRGDPPELFRPGIPVVLEGRWSPDGDWFDSDRMLIKHTNEYEAENPDRLEGSDEPAPADGDSSSGATGSDDAGSGSS